MGNICGGKLAEPAQPAHPNPAILVSTDPDDEVAMWSEKSEKEAANHDDCAKLLPPGLESVAIGILCDMFCTESTKRIPQIVANMTVFQCRRNLKRSEMVFNDEQRVCLILIVGRMCRRATQCLNEQSADTVIDILLFLNWNFTLWQLAPTQGFAHDTLHALLSTTLQPSSSQPVRDSFTHLERRMIDRREELGIVLRHHHVYAILARRGEAMRQARLLSSYTPDNMICELLRLMTPLSVNRSIDASGVYLAEESPHLFLWNAAALQLRHMLDLIAYEKCTGNKFVSAFEARPCAKFFECYPVHADEPLVFGPPGIEQVLDCFATFPAATHRLAKYKALLCERIQRYRCERTAYECGRRAQIASALPVVPIGLLVSEYFHMNGEVKLLPGERFRTISASTGSAQIFMRAF